MREGIYGGAHEQRESCSAKHRRGWAVWKSSRQHIVRKGSLAHAHSSSCPFDYKHSLHDRSILLYQKRGKKAGIDVHGKMTTISPCLALERGMDSDQVYREKKRKREHSDLLLRGHVLAGLRPLVLRRTKHETRPACLIETAPVELVLQSQPRHVFLYYGVHPIRCAPVLSREVNTYNSHHIIIT